MKHQNYFSGVLMAGGIGLLTLGVPAQSAPAAEPYKVLSITQTNGTGGIDYVTADSEGRRIYVPRGNQTLVFDLDTYKCVGAIPNTGLHGVAVDPKTHHGFCSTSPVSMFDTTTMEFIKKITVEGSPDGILFEPATERVYVLGRRAPNVTVIDPKDGSIAGTIDLGGSPEQAASDLKGHVYIDLEDKGSIAVVDAKALKVTATFPLGDNGGSPSGLGLDAKNHILFAMCRPATCVILSADDGKILTTLPLGGGSDGGGFNPNTMEAFSSHGNGTLTIIKENSPTSFEVEQTVQTKPGAKCCSLDTKTGHIILTAIEAAPAAAAEGAATPATPPAGGERAGGDRRSGRGGRGGRGGPGLLDVIVVGR
jgi:DNA-binding beta-propeller fold protein YncE